MNKCYFGKGHQLKVSNTINLGNIIQPFHIPVQFLSSGARVKPSVQLQENEPSVFMHSCWHGFIPAHSSMSAFGLGMIICACEPDTYICM